MLKETAKKDGRPTITAGTFAPAKARLVELGAPGRLSARQPGEIFFSIRRRLPEEAANGSTYPFSKAEYGYTEMSPGMREMFGTLFSDRPDNRSIEFIEWKDSWNAVFEDGIYISSRSCRMEKDEFEKWRASVQPIG